MCKRKRITSPASSVLFGPSGRYRHVPHDAVLSGALTAGDPADVAAALALRPLRLEGLVDGLNRTVSADEVRRAFRPAEEAYRAAEARDHEVAGRLRIGAEEFVRWVLRQ